MRAQLGVFLVLLLSSCGDELPKYFLLDKFRIVALIFDSPEVAPGGTGNLTLVVSDPLGQGGAIQYSAVACVDPGIGLGATPTCEGNPTKSSLGSGTIAGGSLTAATNFTDSINLGLAVTAPAAGVIFLDPQTGLLKSASEQANGVSYLVFISFRNSVGESITTLKRLVVSTKATKNTNPAISAFLINGVDSSLVSSVGSPAIFSFPPTGGSQESYVEQSSSGAQTKTETLDTTCFVSSGLVSPSRIDIGETLIFSPASPIPSVQTWVSIMRDNRGGLGSFLLNK